ncbi:hypothetical protein WSI_00265 [Candidatus Liberibacter asiaticus str. gxpsy]|uniref:Uncharacterized protein n=2 Tax=Liberibacter asiaticus TaxID=34021 RepID=C6XHB8_LIBAP|nr:hypothetical protein CLIBASIA_00355 [Candidatus Liberibacter asiaticus str. psy62]AGH16428.1 hypothetical protein WSI_00265 [Candidatus Liberibacter asiaticus str. gxpsy]BAP25946.1 hypothetical protein CGUJ_00355 [Candidatus Liberibacter asiaticus str. Ishi-1]
MYLYLDWYKTIIVSKGKVESFFIKNAFINGKMIFED